MTIADCRMRSRSPQLAKQREADEILLERQALQDVAAAGNGRYTELSSRAADGLWQVAEGSQSLSLAFSLWYFYYITF